MATTAVLLTVRPIERLRAQGHTGHWWQRPKNPSLAPEASLPSRHAALTCKGLLRQPLSGVTHALVFYTLTQFTLLSAPSPPSCPTSATEIHGSEGSPGHDFTGTSGISGSLCALSKWHAPAYLTCQSWAVVLFSFYLLLLFSVLFIFLCVSFCSPSWSGTQYIAQASLKLIMVHLSAGIINLIHCTPADLSRQIQRQRGVVSKSCLQKQQFPSLQWVWQRQMHIYVASTCNLGQKRLPPSSFNSHWCLSTNSTTINEICEND